MNYDLTILEEGCKEYGIQLNEEQKKQYYIRIGQSQYMLFALDKVEDKQVLTNKQDVYNCKA